MIRYRVDLDIWVDEKSAPSPAAIEKHLRFVLNNYEDVSVVSVKAEQIESEEGDDG